MTAPPWERPTLTDMTAVPVYTGPETGDQLRSLDYLMEIGARQAETADTAIISSARPMPPYTGPVTGEMIAAGSEPERAGRHARSETLRERHAARFASFSAIGGVVLVLGVLAQALLVRLHAESLGSYAGQAVFSIELSYLLNRRLTWRDRGSDLWASFWRFNAQKLALTVPNLALYGLLVWAGTGWLIANLATTAVFTLANYVTGDLWSFAAGQARRHRMSALAAEDAAEIPGLPAGPLPPVSIVIPCKSNERTIRATVDSLLGQDYPALTELILVGDVGDPTWRALADVADPRLILLEQEKIPGQRDPNVKRHKGLSKASGVLLALADSDIVMDPGWLSAAVALLAEQGGGLVAGGMRAIRPHKFWPRFVDRNSLAAKTSRLPRPYFVTARNFGARNRKPPLTANAVFTRDLYDACPLDAAWAYGYEDYEWYWRLAKGGHQVRYHGGLTAAHHHREKFSHLVREYRRSAQGCAEFVRRHPDSPLAVKRRRQAALLPVSCVLAGAAAVFAIATGRATILAAAAVIAVTVLAVREGVGSRSLDAVTYPAAALALGGVFAWTLAGNLLRPADRPAPAWESGTGNPGSVTATRALPVSLRRRFPGFLNPLTAILAVQAVFSGSLIWSNTAFGDEALYLWQGRLEWAHWLHGVPLPVFHDSGSPELYPALAAAAGGLAGARLLSLAFMLASTVLLYATGRRLLGRTAALWGSALWAVSEPVLRLAFATYDPLACLLVIAAVYLVIRSAVSSRRGELVTAAAACLALSALVAVSFAIYIPAVTAVALFAWADRDGWKRAAAPAVWLLAATVAVTALGLTALHMWPDFIGSTVARQEGLGQGVSQIARAAWSWDGVLWCASSAGAILAFASCGPRSPRGWLLAACAGGGFLAPAYQAYLGTGYSMDKHMSAGTAIAALAAGYAASRVSVPGRTGARTAAAFSVALLAFPAISGLWYARSAFGEWPDTTALTADARHYAGPGPLLADSDDGNFNVSILRYYLPQDDWQVSSPGSAPGITSGSYAEVVQELDAAKLDDAALPETALSRSTELKQQVLADAGNSSLVAELEASHRYAIASILPYVTDDTGNASGVFVIWKRIPVPVRHHAVRSHGRRA